MRVPADNHLPGANSFKDAGKVLASTRNTCAYAALGHAVAAFDTALADSKQRMQFGGGNGILLDFHVMRHMADIEAIHTFEGTETMQALIVGRDVTGRSAFV